MRKVRHDVFETNSSSTHSITFSSRKAQLEENTLPIDADGCIHVTLGEFGWGQKSYYDQYNKLQYLVTMCAEANGIDVDRYTEKEQKIALGKLMSCDDFMEIFETIGNYANCTGVYVDYSTGYIDHQSCENYSSLRDFLSDCGTSIIEFVYGNTIVHTDNDNH